MRDHLDLIGTIEPESKYFGNLRHGIYFSLLYDGVSTVESLFYTCHDVTLGTHYAHSVERYATLLPPVQSEKDSSHLFTVLTDETRSGIHIDMTESHF